MEAGAKGSPRVYHNDDFFGAKRLRELLPGGLYPDARRDLGWFKEGLPAISIEVGVDRAAANEHCIAIRASPGLEAIVWSFSEVGAQTSDARRQRWVALNGACHLVFNNDLVDALRRIGRETPR